MKIWILITVAAIIIGIGVVFLFQTVPDLEENSEEKYQYKFWREEVPMENRSLIHRVFFSYSHDYGETFSEPKDVSMTEDSSAEPKMMVMGDDVILVWRDEVPLNSLLSFAISHDFGKTFEKKRLFEGSFPDIVHKNDILYLTWVEFKPFKVFYTKSLDRGETFEEPILIFSPEYEYDPTLNSPKPKFLQDAEILKIKWDFISKDYEFIIEQ
ncbi:MAG: glycoside hydrolase [Nitrosopumilus sp.]|nr:glycoside hydrolase [Nitrosopumilus sp.]MDH3384929.1 glycoside hydrolase [Nitrosopumilus sp.]